MTKCSCCVYSNGHAMMTLTRYRDGKVDRQLHFVICISPHKPGFQHFHDPQRPASLSTKESCSLPPYPAAPTSEMADKATQKTLMIQQNTDDELTLPNSPPFLSRRERRVIFRRSVSPGGCLSTEAGSSGAGLHEGPGGTGAGSWAGGGWGAIVRRLFV